VEIARACPLVVTAVAVKVVAVDRLLPLEISVNASPMEFTPTNVRLGVERFIGTSESTIHPFAIHVDAMVNTPAIRVVHAHQLCRDFAIFGDIDTSHPVAVDAVVVRPV
jgi:hypothetical protein